MTAATCLIIRPLDLEAGCHQMYSITLLVEGATGIERHYLEQTFVQLHDIEHLLARVGYSVEEERETTRFCYAQLPKAEWELVRAELDPQDLEGLYGLDVLINLPEFYRRTYGRYNIEAWLELFSNDGHYLDGQTKTISMYGYELLVG